MTLDQIEQRKPSFRRVFSNRSFSLLWIGQMVSQSGDYIFDIVALWLVLQLTGDIFKVGLTTATILLPPVVIGPLAGVYVDKFNRRDIILLSNIFQATTVAAIAVLYTLEALTFPILLVLLFLLNAGAQFVRPAVTAIIPGLMAKEDLAAANSLFTISSSLNQIAGFGIGGLLVLFLGIELPIYYDSFTFVFASASVFLIARSVLDVPSVTSSASIDGENPSSFMDKFLQGLRFIRTSRLLLEIIALALVLNFFGGGIQALIAPYAKITVHGNSGIYGAMLAALSLGTVLGSIVIGKIEARKYVGKLLFLGVLGTGSSVSVIGFTTVASYSIMLMLVIGVSLAFANLPLQVLIQAKVPGNLLGRVFTSLGALVTVATPIAAVTTGGVATTLQIGPTLQLYGILMIIVTAGAYLIFQEVRDAKY
ncbi:MAG TPA: MFS transporter [Candidatus Bathyarchaeia archaeon]|nr:MFS transporter [Candidatus Bathyarchaeia archaeon]